MISSAVTPEIAGMIITSQRLFGARQYDRAVSVLEQARVKAVEQKDTFTEALVLNRLGLARERTGNFLAARQAFDTAISELSSLSGESSPDLLAVRNNLANLFYESSQPSQAANLIGRNLEALAATGTRDLRTGAELAILSKMQLGEHRSDQAKQSAEAALTVLRETGNTDELSAALAYSVIGAVSDDKNTPGRAEEALQAALSILQKNLEPGDERIAEGMANLGLLYASQGLRERAEPLLKQARARFQAGSLNNSFVRQFLGQWAVVEKKAGRKREAKQLRKEAKALLDRSSEAKMSRYTVDANALR